MNITGVVKNRAAKQTMAGTETRSGVVKNIKVNPINGNVESCDVDVHGMPETIRNIVNSSGLKWFVGAAVTVTFVRGSRTDPQITAGGGSASVASAASDNNVNGSGTGTGTTAITGVPVILASESSLFPDGFVLTNGANIILDYRSAFVASGQVIPNELIISMVIPAYTSLPSIDLTTMLDGQLIRVGSGTTYSLYVLDAAGDRWILLSSTPQVWQSTQAPTNSTGSGTTAFTWTTTGYISGSEDVFLSGIRQDVTAGDYTIAFSAGTLTVTFATAPSATDTVRCRWRSL